MARMKPHDPWFCEADEGPGEGEDGLSGGGADRLFEEILTAGADLRVRVTGRSMAPSLRGGSVVTIRREPVEKLAAGDLVLFRNTRGFLVLHRLVKVRKGGRGREFTAKGDALGAPDLPVGEDRVLGRVCAIEDGERERDVTKLRHRLAGRALARLQRSRPFRAARRLLAALLEGPDSD